MSVLARSRERIGTLAAESLYDNPVVTRELRTRMRGLKGFLVMGGYVLLVGAVLFITYMILWNEYSVSAGSSMNLANQNIGQKMFQVLAWAQAILLSLAIPALTFSSITQELERKSIELLALARLSPGKIVLGKQLSGFLYAMILLACSLPLAAMCLMFGGISPAEIAVMYATLVAWAFLLTCMGVFWSSLFNKTASAALFAYGSMGLYFLQTIPLGVISAPPFYSGGAGFVHPLGGLNPGWAVYTSMLTSSVCGVKLPLTLVAFGLHVALGLLLLMVASTHVRFCRAQRSLPIKLLTMALTLVLIWLAIGGITVSVVPRGSSAIQSLMTGAAPTILSFLCLMAAIFATGRMTKKPGQPMLAYAISPRKTLSGDLGGAIPFMVLWTAVLFGGLMGTFWWMFRTQGAVVPHALWDGGLKLGVASVAIVLGVSAIGVLASSVVKARRNAAALVLLFVILAWSGYGIVLAYYVEGISDTSGPTWQLAAFWPATPIYALSGWSHMPKLWWKPADAWLVCSAAYLVIALAALVLASGPAEKGRGVQEE